MFFIVYGIEVFFVQIYVICNLCILFYPKDHRKIMEMICYAWLVIQESKECLNLNKDDSGSESQSSGESWSFNIIVDLLLVDWFFDNFPGAEWNVSGGVEIGGSLFQGSESGSGGFNLFQLELIKIILWRPSNCR